MADVYLIQGRVIKFDIDLVFSWYYGLHIKITNHNDHIQFNSDSIVLPNKLLTNKKEKNQNKTYITTPSRQKG